MSNEQTVRHAIIYNDEAAPAYPNQVMQALGIPLDMSVTELQRRLRIAERVLSDPVIDLPEWATGEREAFIFDSGVDATLAWLTREDDQ